MSYLSKCEMRGPACKCGVVCSEKAEAGCSTTPMVARLEVALLIKRICLNPYYHSASTPWNGWRNRRRA